MHISLPGFEEYTVAVVVVEVEVVVLVVDEVQDPIQFPYPFAV